MRALTRVDALLAMSALLFVANAAPAAAPPPSERWLDRLVADLGADAFEARQVARKALEQAGSAAVPALLRGMKSGDAEIRSQSLALAKRAEKRAAAFFENLGADVQWHGGEVDIVSCFARDVSRLRDEHLRELVGLPWLKRVFLEGAKVGDAGMVFLGRLTNLEYLDLSFARPSA